MDSLNKAAVFMVVWTEVIVGLAFVSTCQMIYICKLYINYNSYLNVRWNISILL